jgi:hypothetical protein
MNRKLLSLFGCLASLTAGAQVAPKYSNEFLSVGFGARASGMGTSIVASVNVVTSG